MRRMPCHRSDVRSNYIISLFSPPPLEKYVYHKPQTLLAMCVHSLIDGISLAVLRKLLPVGADVDGRDATAVRYLYRVWLPLCFEN